jgi:type II secretion system protein G
MAPRVRARQGFTLVELLIVVAIVGILAAIAIPNLLLAVQRAKQKRTMSDIRTIAGAWEARATDVNAFNAAGWTALIPLSISGLGTALTPTYVRSLPDVDGWGNSFHAFTDTAWGANPPAGRYQVASYGRNGQPEASTPPGPTTAFDCDIVYENGQFLVWPEGTQTDKPQAEETP